MVVCLLFNLDVCIAMIWKIHHYVYWYQYFDEFIVKIN